MKENEKNISTKVKGEDEFMKFKRKFLFIILFSFLMLMSMKTNYSNAALQSNGGTPATRTPAQWLIQMRQMQSNGGTLGRSDNINNTTLLSNATDLDIHMEKNTEYGAMAILSASSYGNPNIITSGGTTTGNSTGIVINFNNERVAAADKDSLGNAYGRVNPRYRNSYDYTVNVIYKPKLGDATDETAGWHNKNANSWLVSYAGQGGLIRATTSGNIFTYYGDGNNTLSGVNAANPSRAWASRAAIVVGTGI